MDRTIPVIGLVGHLAARRLQVALLWRLLMDWLFNDLFVNHLGSDSRNQKHGISLR